MSMPANPYGQWAGLMQRINQAPQIPQQQMPQQVMQSPMMGQTAMPWPGNQPAYPVAGQQPPQPYPPSMNYPQMGMGNGAPNPYGTGVFGPSPYGPEGAPEVRASPEMQARARHWMGGPNMQGRPNPSQMAPYMGSTMMPMRGQQPRNFGGLLGGGQWRPRQGTY